MFGVIAETPAIERQSPRLYFAKNIPHPSPRKAICIVLEVGLGTHTSGTDLLLGKGWRGSRKVGNLGGDWQAQEMPGLGGGQETPAPSESPAEVQAQRSTARASSSYSRACPLLPLRL